MSFPRAGRINAPSRACLVAQILAELGDAAEAGVCPVTHASGKSRGVVFRWACNKNLRLALTCFADNSRHACAWATAIYQKARQRGCKHAHAVRILARAWVRVLWRAWQDGKPCDPARHAGAARII
jgi:transposase